MKVLLDVYLHVLSQHRPQQYVYDGVGTESRRAPPHPYWRLLPALAKWSFLSVWVVALTVLCIRVNVSKEQTLLNLFGFLQESFVLHLWTETVALQVREIDIERNTMRMRDLLLYGEVRILNALFFSFFGLC